ncbi:MAG: hypothetical protein H6736_10265 [Alphaproteobacteria bacterium]|nr:hypothetical protein [Alphaproteobacteria bacterium]MCB9692184.1 hypothetical protein [Alphaproteobacteria bacterium]
MRWTTAGVVLGLALACGGGRPPITVERGGFRIDLLDGTVDEDVDHGAEGDYDVSAGLSTQALSWVPVDPDEDLVAHVDRLALAMEALSAANDLETGPASYEDGVVDGQVARTVSFEASGATIVSSSWDCPAAGVRGTLTSTGLFGTRGTHDAALASVVCGQEPVALELPEAFRFTGDASWRSILQGELASWQHEDGRLLLVTGQSAIGDDFSTCGVMIDLFLSSQDLLVEPEGPATTAAPDGCVRTVRGPWEGDPASARVRYRSCRDRGYLAVCLVERGEPDCVDQVVCP